MKIFLSYGHDDNTWLVERLRDDLQTAGHEVWFDRDKIETGADWRRAITDGLADTDWVIGFLSKHSVRQPGVCLDELGIALHRKGGAIATVLLEGDADPPVSVSDIQWIDMRDWRTQAAQGGAAWDTWYAGKRDTILALLASPHVKHFAGEIATLEASLDPVSQQEDIGRLIENFVGRDWLLARLEAWRTDARDSRLLWIAGAAGTGKSAFAAWLGHHGKVNVIGLNLCAYNRDDRRDAGRVLRTLAFQVATRLPDYRRLLLDRLARITREDLLRQQPAALFALLLAEPLARAIEGGRGADRFLIVIDGLDETVTNGRSELVEVLSSEAAKLPAWIALVVTGRPEGPIQRQLGGLRPLMIDAAATENLADLRKYVRDWLAASPQGADDLIERIVAASEGNFLYVSKLREAVAEGTLRLDAPRALPQGLGALYERWLRHRFPTEAAYAPHRPLIEVLVAAEHAVPEPWLELLLGDSRRGVLGALEGLGSLFERRADGVAPFHKSLRDWLADPDASGAFSVEVGNGTGRLLHALWAALVADATAATDDFVLAELPSQVARSAAPALAGLLGEGWAEARERALFDVPTRLRARYGWPMALAWLRMDARLADVMGGVWNRDRAFALAGIGDIQWTLGRTEEALRSFRDGLGIMEQLAVSDPANAVWQRDLSVFNERIGDVQVAQGDRAGALESFRAGFAIAERLAVYDPANAVWQRDLSLSHGKIGDVLVLQGDRAGALTSFRLGLAIRERLATSDPANSDWQRDLATSYGRIGIVLIEQGDRAGALKSFRDSHVIAARLAASDRANAGWQHDLAMSCGRVGDALDTLGDRGGALRSFRDGLAIMERLVASDPANTGWQRDIAVSYQRIGDTLVALGDPAGALKSVRESLAIRRRLAASDPANAVWCRDLSMSYGRDGDMLVVQGDRAGALKSFRDGLAIAERLAASDPANVGGQLDLAAFHERVGDVLVALGDRAAALKSFRDRLAIAERLAVSAPANARWQRDLSVSYNRVGDVLVSLGDRADARKSFRDGFAVAERLAASDPVDAGCQRDLVVFCVKVSETSPEDARMMLTRAQAIVHRLRDDGRLAEADAMLPSMLAGRIAALGASAEPPRRGDIRERIGSWLRKR